MFVFFGYLMLFAIGAVGGWCLEIVFRRFFSAKKWINPGFLRGPYLPLYGFGTCLMYAVCSIPIDEIWAKLLIIALSMTLIEYIAGLIFIKGLKIKLWDYSNRWGNLQGIICPLFSLIWGAVGAGFLFLLYPALSAAVAFIPKHLWLLFIIGLFYGILFIDFAVCFKLSVKLRSVAKELRYAVNYEKLKLKIWLESRKGSRRALFLAPFKTSGPISETIKALADEERAAPKKHRFSNRKKIRSGQTNPSNSTPLPESAPANDTTAMTKTASNQND